MEEQNLKTKVIFVFFQSVKEREKFDDGEKNKIKGYLKRKDFDKKQRIEKVINEHKNRIKRILEGDINPKIKELLKAKFELNSLNKAEAIKKKNKEMEDFIKDNELNTFLKVEEDYRPNIFDEKITNGTYFFRIKLSK